MIADKGQYTARELSPLLGITERAVLLRAEREKWEFVPRSKRGGGKAWVAISMPPATRDIIASAMLREAHAASDTAPAICANVGTGHSPARSPEWMRANDREREVAMARLAFVREVERIAGIVGKEKAIRHLADSSCLGNLSPILMELIPTATACKRDGTLSRRSLYRWMADYAERGEDGLLPSLSKARPTPAWFDEFLRHYQRPQHPSVALAYDEFRRGLAARGEVSPPSIHAVRRLLAKMSNPAREAGRATGNALLKLRPYQRRDTSELWPGDVYTADGTTFDAEVLHPGNGQPFKPELTAIVDVATRRCVGVSINLSESKLTVLDALRMACMWAGIPAMFYSDSGPGYDNKLLLDDRTGMMQRLGITPCNAIPGRPQGKGLMERAVQTLWVRAAQGLASYTGALMDADAAHRNYKNSRAAIKKGKRSILPTWDECKKHILARVDEYNATPHRGLPRYRDAAGRMVHYSPNEYWQTFEARGFEPVLVPKGMGAELFMPGERRITRNGWVQMYGGRYYAEALAEYHGESVEVRYDIWDSARVWCWTLNGRKIAQADLEGNTRPYFAESRVQAAREKRARAQVSRIDAKLQRVAPGAEIILPDDRPALADSTQPIIIDMPAPRETVAALMAEAETEAAAAQTVRPVFACTFDRYRWLMRNPARQTLADMEFLTTYRLGEEYADLRELLEAEGIA